MDYKLEVDEKNKVLRIEIPLIDEPRLSKTKRSRLVATTSGHIRTKVKYHGEHIMFGVNAFIPLPKKPVDQVDDNKN